MSFKRPISAGITNFTPKSKQKYNGNPKSRVNRSLNRHLTSKARYNAQKKAIRNSTSVQHANRPDFGPTIKVTSLQPPSYPQRRRNSEPSRRSKKHKKRHPRSQSRPGFRVRPSTSSGIATISHPIKKGPQVQARTHFIKFSNPSETQTQTARCAYSVRDRDQVRSASHRQYIRTAAASTTTTTKERKPENKPENKATNSCPCPVVFRARARARGRAREQTVKNVNRERLNLDDRNLTACPMLQNEQHLRLLNYENNLLTRITNLQNVPNLIFLDLYNNKISKIENLECVPLLRVLMLGRNEICKVENLSGLKYLDVLDLHSNSIRFIENLDNLSELRVLNLAGNSIQTVENLSNLSNLVELNLRRNKVSKFKLHDSFAMHNKLQRVLLSNNLIQDMKCLLPLTFAPFIQQFSIDQNPILNLLHKNKNKNKVGNELNHPIYAQILSLFPKLKQLNNNRVTIAMRQQLLWNSMVANTHLAEQQQQAPTQIESNKSNKDPDPDSDSDSDSKTLLNKKLLGSGSGSGSVSVSEVENEMNSWNTTTEAEAEAEPTPMIITPISQTTQDKTKEKFIQEAEQYNQILITTIKKQWQRKRQKYFINNANPSSSSTGSSSSSSSSTSDKEFFQLLNENKLLKLYGCGMPMPFHKQKLDDHSLNLNLNLNLNILKHVQEMEFNFVDFNQLTKYFNYFKTLTDLRKIVFNDCNIHSLYQIDALSVVAQIKTVVFAKSNPITQTAPTLHRLYCIFRLPDVSRINTQPVSDAERKSANEKFSLLREQWKNKNILLTRGFCAPVLHRVRNIHYPRDDDTGTAEPNPNPKPNPKPEASTSCGVQLHKLVTSFPNIVGTKRTTFSTTETDLDRRSNIVRQCILNTQHISDITNKLHFLWPSIVEHLIDQVIQDMENS